MSKNRLRWASWIISYGPPVSHVKWSVLCVSNVGGAMLVICYSGVSTGLVSTSCISVFLLGSINTITSNKNMNGKLEDIGNWLNEEIKRFPDNLQRCFRNTAVSRPWYTTSNFWKRAVESLRDIMKVTGSRNRRSLHAQLTTRIPRKRGKQPSC